MAKFSVYVYSTWLVARFALCVWQAVHAPLCGAHMLLIAYTPPMCAVGGVDGERGEGKVREKERRGRRGRRKGRLVEGGSKDRYYKM